MFSYTSYLSVAEALKHGGVANRADVNIKWIDSEVLNDDNAEELLGDCSGIIVPGGFGRQRYRWYALSNQVCKRE